MEDKERYKTGERAIAPIAATVRLRSARCACGAI